MTRLSEQDVRAALPLLRHLPEPVLWIGTDYDVLWSNDAASRTYNQQTARCHAQFHGLDLPCNEMGEPCPKLEAEALGATASAVHAHLDLTSEPGLFRVVALPLESGGVLELHLALGSELIRDRLTGLFRKEYWLEIARRGQALLERLERPYSLIFLDLDRFKDFNDAYGHVAGDELLRGVGREVRKSLRASDAACRFGGEEMVLFLPNTDAAATLQVARRLCQSIAELTVETDSGWQGVTTSVGTYTAEPEMPLEESLRRTDKALYRAKAAGRGQVFTHP